MNDSVQPVGLPGFVLPHVIRKGFRMRDMEVVANQRIGFAQAIFARTLVDGQRR
ncbi:hypothetical protein [Hymenobacter metallicola]|uniref:hypothetical protein n=1 Tax=Hymenobacter metallicola TaxID=2563114 RepID=UPI001436B6FA|nr:hypothetical protein [Hymenobacter metallicola]